MRKKVVALLLAVCMVFGLSACGSAEGGMVEKGGKNPLAVTIEGKKYDLSRDIQTVVGEIVKEGIVVQNPWNMMSYDENGKFTTTNRLELIDKKTFIAGEKLVMGTFDGEPLNNLVQQYFSLYRPNTDYKTADGITLNSEAEDAAKLEYYVKQNGYFKGGNEAYAALYMDSKIIDLQTYAGEFEKLIEEYKQNGGDMFHAYAADWRTFTCTPFGINVGVISATDGDMGGDLLAALEDEKYYWEEQLLLTLAMTDAGKKLLAGEIQNYTLIVYEFNEADGEVVAYTYYYNYYLDDAYDQYKFNPDK